MLKISVFSLLLGALALLASITLLATPPGAAGQHVPSIYLGPDNAKAVAGEAKFDGEGLRLRLNQAGVGVISITGKNIETANYPFWHLAIASGTEDLNIFFTWETDAAVEKQHTFVPQSRAWHSLWLAASEVKEWTGDVSALNLAIVGTAGATVQIKELALHTDSPLHRIQSVISDLTAYVPWNRAAMNSHTGVMPTSSFYPNLLAAALLLLSLLAYGVLLLVLPSRFGFRFRWQVVALIFLACWISLDMFWQRTLTHQVFDTARTFAGKSSHEKLLVGPDANLYAFVTKLIPLVEHPDARIFVSSTDTYMGQRGAYFLYPFNVFWPGPAGEFPADTWLRSGDLVLLIYPSTMRFHAATHQLATSANTTLGAELVFNDPLGTLVKVK